MIIKIYLQIVAFNVICIMLGELVLRYKSLMSQNDISPLTALKNIHRISNSIELKMLLGLIIVPFSALKTLIHFVLIDPKDLKQSD